MFSCINVVVFDRVYTYLPTCCCCLFLVSGGFFGLSSFYCVPSIQLDLYQHCLFNCERLYLYTGWGRYGSWMGWLLSLGCEGVVGFVGVIW